MKTCKDCIHCDVCLLDAGTPVNDCNYFKDKFKFIESPCSPGDIIYASVRGFKYPISFEVMGGPVLPIYHPGVDTFVKLSEFGKIVFLTLEEAEKNMETLNEKDKS